MQEERLRQIPIVLKNVYPILMRQQLEYQVFVIYQAPAYWFNRGALLNVGYLEAMKIRHWDCFIFHDVDTIPADDRNFYNGHGHIYMHIAGRFHVKRFMFLHFQPLP